MNDMEEKGLTPVGSIQDTQEKNATGQNYQSDTSSEASEEGVSGRDRAGNDHVPPPQRPIPPSWQPVRRVGTITMGLSLIAAGILILCGLLIPNFPLASAAKFAPLILVFLGIEILLRYFSSKGEKLKYDFLSGFVCLLLIFASIIVSILPTFFTYYGPQRYVIEERMEQMVSADLCDRLSINGDVSYVETNVNLLHGQPLDLQAEQLTDEQVKALKYDSFVVNFHLLDKFEDANAFAQACKRIITAAQETDYPMLRLCMYNSSFSIEVSSQLASTITVEDLALQVEDYSQMESDLEEQYQEGYEVGLEAGETSGYESGYDEGHTDGYEVGYDQGYAEGFLEGREQMS